MDSKTFGNEKSMRFNPIKDKAAEIIEWFLSNIEGNVSDDVLFKVNLAVEEAVQNVVDYAYENGLGFLEASVKFTDQGVLVIKIIDGGVKFNPLDASDPDITLSATDRAIGGLGIFLCKKLMDKVSYSYENGCNILVMEKTIK